MSKFGGPDQLEVIVAPMPTVGRGEVQVRVLASGIEYTDVLIRRHLYPQPAAPTPRMSRLVTSTYRYKLLPNIPSETLARKHQKAIGAGQSRPARRNASR